ncbi:MAG: hypothetical protein P4L85_14205 [Paludisphaera borealis]|uniref:hypothetical protein n=1 Tax=Paludisphaera borealis TaxID=1387353 RepID=UPI00284B3466|nr:hypothetical protein [Paludisphaera borealis]MDR3620499.1 hypothetical protein [Paludisphaera borealis]
MTPAEFYTSRRRPRHNRTGLWLILGPLVFAAVIAWFLGWYAYELQAAERYEQQVEMERHPAPPDEDSLVMRRLAARDGIRCVVGVSETTN